MQLEQVPVRREPFLPLIVEVVGGAVVDDQEELPRAVLRDELLQVDEEGLTVEDLGEPEGEIGFVERDRSIDVRRFSQSEGVDARLKTDSRPGLMEGAIEPKARFVLEGYEAAAARGFFLIAGSRSRSQMACFSASARASRFRGRCTENPILFRSRGT